LKSGVTSEWRSDDPWPAEIVLQCIGATRVLYEVRIGDGALQQNYRTNWTKWSVTHEQQVQLMDLLTPRNGE
jgi:hypothetical protein